MDKYIQLDTFTRYTRVSRETIKSLINYEKILVKANKNLNLIGKSTIDNIWVRHFLDSAQLIDFIDKNCKTLVDLGSGAGFPGVILALIVKDRKIPLKIKLIDKSPKKIKFLNDLTDQLNLKCEILNENIFDKTKILTGDVYVARAFKPIGKILELIHSNAKNWKKVFVFLGKNGKSELLQASKTWDIEYKESISVTSGDSWVIEINKIKKK